MSSRALGVLQAILSGVCFGFLGLFGKMTFRAGVNPSELLSLRFLISAGVLFAYFAILAPRKLRIGWRSVLACGALGVFGYAVFSSCFFRALQGLSASLTVLLLYTYPVMVAAGGWILFGEKIPVKRLWAIPVTLFGLVLLVRGDLSVDRSGALLYGLASAVFYAAYILASSRWTKTIDPLVSAGYIQLSAGVVLAVLFLRDNAGLIDRVGQAWPSLLGIALIGTVAAMSLFLASLQRLRSWEVSLLSTTEPLTGVLVAALFLGERLRSEQIVGGLLVLGCLIWINVPKILIYKVTRCVNW